MNAARMGVLALAVVAAGLAALLARSLVASKEPVKAEVAVAPVTEVLVSARDIEVGARLDSTSLRWQGWPANAVSTGFITKAAAPTALTDYDGSVVRAAMLAGEPVMASKIVNLKNAGFMSALVQPGMRALAINVTPQSSAGGFILPNDRVDVLMTRRSQDEESGTQTVQGETILRNVHVLAVDQSFNNKSGDEALVGKTVTLEVTPSQAELLTLSAVEGDISLSLRSIAETGGENDEQIPKASGNVINVVRFGVEQSVKVK